MHGWLRKKRGSLEGATSRREAAIAQRSADLFLSRLPAYHMHIPPRVSGTSVFGTQRCVRAIWSPARAPWWRHAHLAASRPARPLIAESKVRIISSDDASVLEGSAGRVGERIALLYSELW